jgi:hypothetical protein
MSDAGTPTASSVWLSQDGIAWEQVADTGRVPMIDVAATDGTQVVAFKPAISFGDRDPGVSNPDLLERSPMYYSPDGQEWQLDPFVGPDGWVKSAEFTSDGRLLLSGVDVSGCKEFFCGFVKGAGAIPTIWIGTPG